MKKSEIVLIILLLSGGLYMVSKTIHNKILRRSITIELMQDSIVNQQKIIDSLTVTHRLLGDYYCFTENLFDSIYMHLDREQFMIFNYDFRIYNRITDTLYYNHEHLYKYLDDRKDYLWIYYKK